MSELERAIAIAAEAHAGQVDKGGKPYIFHPLRVMLSVAGRGRQFAIAGVLHDVVEDCPLWSLNRLEDEGIPMPTLYAVDALSRRAGEGYSEFIERCAVNSMARAVKIADLMDNLNPDRLGSLSQRDDDRMLRYRTALVRLSALPHGEDE